MRVLFIYNEVECLALQYLSSALRQAGHETALLFDPRLFDGFRQEYNNRLVAKACSLKPWIVKQMREYQPDVVGFSVLTANADWCASYAEEARKHLPNATIVAGGYHATTSPGPMLRTGLYDWVIRGEAEDAFVGLVNSLEVGGVDRSLPNLAYLDPAHADGELIENPLTPYEQDLDRYAEPDKELFLGLGSPFRVGHMVEWRRGCPWGCTFCGNNAYRKMYYPDRADYMYTRDFLRSRSVTRVLDELRYVKAKYDPKVLRVNDDDICADEAWLKELAERMTDAERIPFKCFAIPNNINERTIRYLKQIGCAQIQMGVQSLNPEIRKMLGRPNSEAQIARAIDLAREHKIGLFVDQIFGLPGETEDDLRTVESFYQEHVPDCVSIYWLDIWAGADILQQSVDAGTITQETADAIKQYSERGDISTMRRYHNDFAKPYAWRIDIRNVFGKHMARFLIGTGLYRVIGRLNLTKFIKAWRVIKNVNHLHAFPPAREVYDITWARHPRLVAYFIGLRVKLALGLVKRVPMVVLPPVDSAEVTKDPVASQSALRV
ncbi:MAG: radical SAM protein [Planctomycetota bacterium]|nr:radical SAM protein [Planctomycetota bacterium]